MKEDKNISCLQCEIKIRLIYFKNVFLFNGSYVLLGSVRKHYISNVCRSVWPKSVRKLDTISRMILGYFLYCYP